MQTKGGHLLTKIKSKPVFNDEQCLSFICDNFMIMFSLESMRFKSVFPAVTDCQTKYFLNRLSFFAVYNKNAKVSNNNKASQICEQNYFASYLNFFKL
jgi:hypothetical protein